MHKTVLCRSLQSLEIVFGLCYAPIKSSKHGEKWQASALATSTHCLEKWMYMFYFTVQSNTLEDFPIRLY